jgi:hypothetical protein
LNMGSVEGRRYRDRCLALEFQLRTQGASITPVLQSKIARAARLAIIAEQMGERALRGEPVDAGAPTLSDLVKAENLAARAVRELANIARREPDGSPSLRDYLATLPDDSGGVLPQAPSESAVAAGADVPADHRMIAASDAAPAGEAPCASGEPG